ncbi:hypothetical protein CHS0354_007450 [Potamilus streckersoni]|uniref:GTP cyclohydrolase 1 feedback regulatory protein n=1 Tax=Potamilus streckersoni TaxID=2493646 RepID=A0AAE0W3D4_9BIVA|nr:hypothetical protein CHS0354_007450 [Potamilus streckersoni]
MQYLGAVSMKTLGNNFIEYRTNDPPRIVLDKLEKRGYRVLSTAGIGSTFVWTLHKEDGPSKLSADDNNMNIRNTI